MRGQSTGCELRVKRREVEGETEGRIMNNVVRDSSPFTTIRYGESISCVSAKYKKISHSLGRTGLHAVFRVLVVIAFYVRVLVAVEIRQKAALVVQSVFQSAGADRYLGGEIFQIPVVHDPLVAKFLRPLDAVHSFPLRPEIPRKWDRSAPQAPA